MPSSRPPAGRRLLLAVALTLLPALALAAPVTATDDTGQRLTLPRPAQRIVTLAPHLAELVHAAGGGAALVAVGRYSNFPESVQRLPVVGDAFAVDYEAVVKLKPDLVLVWGSGMADRHKAQLRALALPVYEAEIRDVDGIASTLRRLGTLLGHTAPAEAAAAALQRDWQALRARHAGRAPLRVFYQLWAEPLMTVNGAHGISQAITACGGVNVFAGLAPLTPTIGWEAAVQADPQLIVGSGTPDDAPLRQAWARFPQVSAVRQGRYAMLDGDLIGRMGPRFVQGAQALCEAIGAAR